MFKKVLTGLIIGLVLTLLVFHAWKTGKDRSYFAGYDPHAPVNLEVAEDINLEGYRRIKFYFDGVSGERVPSLLTLPLQFEGRLPCIVFLHGIGQKKEFLNEITLPFNEIGWAVATFDQFMQGERKLSERGAIAQARAFRQRPAKTINETRRIIDYLQTRPDIDHERIYLVGASYGAITGSTAAAFDTRIKAAALIYGAGNIWKMLDASAIKGETGILHPLVKSMAVYLLGPADPLRYVELISPRPVLFQNGTHDILIDTDAAKALQEKAGEPKKIIWYDSDHVGMDEANTRQVLADCLLWLQEQDAAVKAKLAQPATAVPAQQDAA